jgi:hypothetical protein
VRDYMVCAAKSFSVLNASCLRRNADVVIVGHFADTLGTSMPYRSSAAHESGETSSSIREGFVSNKQARYSLKLQSSTMPSQLVNQ